MKLLVFELDKNKPYKLYDTSGELLSALTPNVDTGEAAIKDYQIKNSKTI